MSEGQHHRNFLKDDFLIIDVGNIIEDSLCAQISGRACTVGNGGDGRGIQCKQIQTPEYVYEFLFLPGHIQITGQVCHRSGGFNDFNGMTVVFTVQVIGVKIFGHRGA